MKIRLSDIQNHITCGLVINNVESLLGLERPHLFSENNAPDSSWKAFFPADAVLSPLNKHWGDPDRLWLLKIRENNNVKKPKIGGIKNSWNESTIIPKCVWPTHKRCFWGTSSLTSSITESIYCFVSVNYVLVLQCFGIITCGSLLITLIF